MLTITSERSLRFRRGRSDRPALTHLAWLVVGDPTVAERLLRGDPVDAVITHPHYAVKLDARDCATLADIRTRSHTVGEFLSHLADIVDGTAV
jgi:hypothetical protein